MPANKELFSPVAIIATIALREGYSGDSAIKVFDKCYDYLDNYSHEKTSREPFRITQTLPGVKYDV